MTESAVNNLGGPMDGHRERTAQEILSETMIPAKAYATAIYRSAKPLSVFLSFSAPPTSPESLSHRIQSNIKTYAGNYILIAACLCCVFLLRTPTALFPLIGLGATWVWFVGKNEDPNWQPLLAGYALDKNSRKTALMAVTFVVLLMFALDTAIYTAFVCSAIIAVHAAVNPGSTLEAVGLKEGDALNQI